MTSHLKVHYFQHIAGEGFGSCYTYLKQQGAVISATEFFALPIDQATDDFLSRTAPETTCGAFGKSSYCVLN